MPINASTCVQFVSSEKISRWIDLDNSFFEGWKDSQKHVSIFWSLPSDSPTIEIVTQNVPYKIRVCDLCLAIGPPHYDYVTCRNNDKINDFTVWEWMMWLNSYLSLVFYVAGFWNLSSWSQDEAWFRLFANRIVFEVFCQTFCMRCKFTCSWI